MSSEASSSAPPPPKGTPEKKKRRLMRSQGWEYRVFWRKEGVEMPVNAREDVYYPALRTLGVKLRNLDPSALEVKELVEREGHVELWSKTWHSGCVGPDLELRDDATRRALGDDAADALSKYRRVRVSCRKQKHGSGDGESGNSILQVRVDGNVVLEEAYGTRTNEYSSAGACRRAAALARITQPRRAFVASYPELVCDLADRALSSTEPSGTAETTDIAASLAVAAATGGAAAAAAAEEER